MKNLTGVFSLLSIIGVGILFWMQFSKNKSSSSIASSVATNTFPATGKIAYVDIDSFDAHYDYEKNKKEEFKKKQEQAEGELQRSYQQMQADYAEVQKKAQANTLTQAEYETAQKRLGQMQQSLETRKQALTDQMLKYREDLNVELKQHLDVFLSEYNKDKHFDFILSYVNSGSSPVLYGNKALDITNDVITGMNEQYKNEKDTKKKN